MTKTKALHSVFLILTTLFILLCLLLGAIKGVRDWEWEMGDWVVWSQWESGPWSLHDLCLTLLLPYFVSTGKIHTPMEYKGELASYDMQLR